MITKRILMCVIVALAHGSGSASGSPQLSDTVYFGGHKYTIHQNPMCGLWYFGDGEVPNGTQRPPTFDVTSPNNWIGYSATWQIHHSQLFLKDIRGKLRGKMARNESILPQLTFPALATWFTGRIHMPVGNFNEDKNEFEAVIVFDIEKGCVKKMEFYSTAPPNYTLDGVK